MNIIALTSSMADQDFNEYAERATIKPNPSNQNFYNKLLNALSINNRVFAFSLRPFVKGMFDEEELSSKMSSEGTITYFYPNQKCGKKYKALEEVKHLYSQLMKFIEDMNLEEYVVVVDTLRVPLLKIADKIKIEKKCKVVGVVTDNPANLSNPDPTYIKLVKKYSKNFNGYITLTESLNRIFNPLRRPNYVMEGLVDECELNMKLPLGKYVFFAGSLYDRYGVKRMVDAFHRSHCPYNFVIAGKGDLQKYISDISSKDRRFLYLSMLDKETVYNLEAGAVACINPRPYDMKLDRESVPSKLLEYFASGSPVITTKNTKLKELFLEDATWLDDDSALNFEKMFNRLEATNKTELNRKATTAKLKVYQYYGLRPQGLKMTQFIESLSTPSNTEEI